MAAQDARDRTSQVQTSTMPTQLRTLYLTLFNLLFASLWLSIGVTALKHLPSGRLAVFNAVEPFARWVQTATVIEILHAALGTPLSP